VRGNYVHLIALHEQIADVDGNEESRKGAVSLFNGPKPDIETYASQESEGVADWLRQLAKAGLQPHEIALFVRSAEQIDRATRAAELAGIKYRVLDEHVEVASGFLPVCTMHLAKGLEFRAVGVMACDDEVIPLQERIQVVADESDLADVYSTERHLLYVALSLSCAIWTEDTDFFGTGVAVWSSDRVEIFLKEQSKPDDLEEF